MPALVSQYESLPSESAGRAAGFLLSFSSLSVSSTVSVMREEDFLSVKGEEKEVNVAVTFER